MSAALTRGLPRYALVVLFATFSTITELLAEPIVLDTSQFEDEMEILGDIPTSLTATRLEQPVTDSPVSLTIIDREQIEAYDPESLVDVLRLVPGIQVLHPNGYRVAVSYHGLGDQFSRRLQVLIDGRSVYSPTFGQVEWQELPLQVEDIERIEVIRGPNAASYGANAFTATVNIITRNPADQQGTFLKLKAGDRSTQRYVARFGGRSEKWDYRITTAYSEDDGFDSIEFPDDKRNASFTFRGDYHANPDNDFEFQFGYNDSSHQSGDLTPISDNLIDPLRQTEGRTRYELIRWKHRINDDKKFSLQFFHNYQAINDNYQTAPVDTLFPTAPFPPFSTLVGAPNQGINLSQSRLSNRYDLEFTYTHKPFDTVRMVWGTSARLDQAGATGLLDRDSNHDFVSNQTYRLFGHGEWKPNSKWTINAGLLAEDNNTTGTDFSPRLSANYHYSLRHTFRTSVSRAFRTPSILEDRSTAITRLSDGRELDQLLFGNRNLDPEKITSLELAYIGNFPSLGINTDIKLFYDHIDDPIINVDDVSFSDPVNALLGQQVSTGVFTFINGSRIDSKGIEAQLDYQMNAATRIHLGYTLLNINGRTPLDINNRSFANGIRSQNSSQEAPRTISTMQIIHDLEHDIRVSASAHHYSQYQINGGSGDPVDPYSVLNIRIAKKYKLGESKGQIALSLQNLLGDYFDFFESVEFDNRLFLSAEIEFN